MDGPPLSIDGQGSLLDVNIEEPFPIAWSTGRGRRARRPTWKILEGAPEALEFPEVEDQTSAPHPEAVAPAPAPMLTRAVNHLIEVVRSTKSYFGISRLYQGRPTYIPDTNVDLAQLYAPTASAEAARKARSVEEIISPYPSLNAWRWDNEFWNGGDTLSQRGRKGMQNIFKQNPGFSDSIADVDFEKIKKEINSDHEAPWTAKVGERWKNSDVIISIPVASKTTKASRKVAANLKRRRDADSNSDDSDELAPSPSTNGASFTIPGLYHRSLTGVIKHAFSDHPTAKHMHLHPFSQKFEPTPSSPGDTPLPPEDTYGELYTSEAFLEVDAELQRSPPEVDCTLPRIVAALMWWSDATSLAQFGIAKMWPIYLFFGNLSKYLRGRPSSGAAHHIAYIPSVGLLLISLSDALTDDFPYSCLILFKTLSVQIVMAKLDQDLF